MQQALERAEETASDEGRLVEAVPQFRDIVLGGQYGNDAESLKIKEKAIDGLVQSMVKLGDSGGLKALLADLRSWFGVIPKAKTAKIVRTIIDGISEIPNSTEIMVSRVSAGFMGRSHRD